MPKFRLCPVVDSGIWRPERKFVTRHSKEGHRELFVAKCFGDGWRDHRANPLLETNHVVRGGHRIEVSAVPENG